MAHPHLKLLNLVVLSSLITMEANPLANSLYSSLETDPVFRVCISGGPCGGKTKLMARVKDIFKDKGFQVIILPQIPTLVALSGININTSQMDLKQKLHLQASMIRMKIAVEDEFTKMATKNPQPTIVFSDRGTMDSCAYMTSEEFNTVFNEEGWNIVNMRDKRYDVVVFLVTAADGAENYYTLANNEARHEDLSQSRELDIKTLDAWNGHPHLVVVDNQVQSFDEKIQIAVENIEKVLGMQSDLKWKKFLVDEVSLPQGMAREVLDVEEVFLTKPHNQGILTDKIRKRGQNGSYSYQRILKMMGEKGREHKTLKIQLKPVDYLVLLNTKTDPNHEPLRKKRTQFLYNKNVFAIDEVSLNKPLSILAYVQREGKPINAPSFLKIGKEVTYDSSYNWETLSRKRDREQNP